MKMIEDAFCVTTSQGKWFGLSKIKKEKIKKILPYWEKKLF